MQTIESIESKESKESKDITDGPNLSNLLQIYETLFGKGASNITTIVDLIKDYNDGIKKLNINSEYKNLLFSDIETNINKLVKTDKKLYNNLKELIDAINNILSSGKEEDIKFLQATQIDRTTIEQLYDLGKKTALLQIHVLYNNIQSIINSLDDSLVKLKQLKGKSEIKETDMSNIIKLTTPLKNSILSYSEKIDNVMDILNKNNKAHITSISNINDDIDKFISADSKTGSKEISRPIKRQTISFTQPVLDANVDNDIAMNQDEFIKEISDLSSRMENLSLSSQKQKSNMSLQGGYHISQYGGNKNILDSFNNAYILFNSEIYRKFFTITGDKNAYLTLTNKLFPSNKNNLIDMFYINIPKSINLNEFTSPDLQDILSFSLKQDTSEYVKIKRYSNEQYSTNNNYLFVTRILSFFNYTLMERNRLAIYLNIYELLVNQYQIYVNIYNTLKEQPSLLNKLYLDVANKIKKVYTYLKIRNDNIINPRNIVKLTNNNMIIRYINTDKSNTEIINDTNLKPELYTFGPYDGIYTKTNQEMAESYSLQNLMNEMNNGKTICFIGYGPSGSGKTSTLIYLDTFPPENGIVVNLCNQLHNIYSDITIYGKEINVKYSDKLRSTSSVETNDYIINNLNPSGKEFDEFVYNEQGWYNKDNNEQNIGEFMIQALQVKRNINPTPNNPESSRSHAILVLNFKDKTKTKNAFLVVCDLAGVENTFACEDNNTIFEFIQQYTKNSKCKNKTECFVDYETKGKNETTKCDITKYNNRDELNLLNKLNTLVQDFKLNTDKNLIDSIKEQITKLKNSKFRSNFSDKINDNNSVISAQRKISDPFYIKDNQIFNWLDMSVSLNYTKNGEYYYTFPSFNVDNIQELTILKNYEKDIYRMGSIIDSNFSTFIREKLRLVDEKISHYTKLKDYYSTIDNYKKETDNINTIIQQYNQIKTDLTTNKSIPTYIIVNDWAYISTTIIDKIIKRSKCLENIIDRVKDNCIYRKKEGFMINRSLYDMRRDIENIVLNSSLGIIFSMFHSYDTSFCTNLYSDKNYFERMDPYWEILKLKYNNSKSTNKITIGGKIIETINSIIKNINNTDSDILFAIVAVINVSRKSNTGDEIKPKIPYININKLKYLVYKGGVPLPEKQKELNNIVDTLKQFDFYKSNPDKTLLSSKLINNESLNTDDTFIKNFINEIDIINSSTMIGALESTERIRKLFSTPIACHFMPSLIENFTLPLYVGSDNEQYDIRNIIKLVEQQKDIPDYNLQISLLKGGFYFNKYIKYKRKYTNLKYK